MARKCPVAGRVAAEPDTLSGDRFEVVEQSVSNRLAPDYPGSLLSQLLAGTFPVCRTIRTRITFMVDTARSREGHNMHETQYYSKRRRLAAGRIWLGRWKSKDACARVHAAY